MEWEHSWDLQENGSNGFLEWRGRRWYDWFLIWSSLAQACKEKKGGEEEEETTAELREIAGKNRSEAMKEGLTHFKWVLVGPIAQSLQWLKH